MRRALLFVLPAACLWTAGVSLAAQPPAPPAAAGQPLTIEEKLEFLRTAEVVASKEVGKGVTRSRRLTLRLGDYTHAAHFQPVDEESWTREYRRERADLRFKDYWGYNVAAFELARLLGWDEFVPPTVQRSIDGQRGALAWWVDDIQFDENGRVKAQATSPDELGWSRQVQRMRLFTELVGDSDRNQGNILITNDWRLVLIDFTRGFCLRRHVMEPIKLRQVEATALERLRTLTYEEVRSRLGPWVSDVEIKSLLHRRDSLLKHFEQLLAERGARFVILS
jgi:hypothetical protein